MKYFRLLAIVGLMSTASLSVTAVKADTMMSSTLKCPSCGMQMTPKKTAMNTVPLMVHGKKYYCCPMCASGSKAAAYDKAHPGKVFVAVK